MRLRVFQWLIVFLCCTTALAQPFRETKLVAHDGAELDQFGASVAIWGDWAAVGAPGRDDQGSNSGAVYMFRKSGDTWRFSQKLLANDGAAGYAFAGVSLRGDYLAVGATGARYNGITSGAVYVFKRAESTWVQVRKIGPEPAVSGSFFGLSISLGQGKLLIGSPLDREAGVTTGAAYVFVRNGEDWIQEARLLASDRREMHWFGRKVSLGDSIALVGAPHDSNGNGLSAGAGYAFGRHGLMWNQTAKLVATNGLPEDNAANVAIDSNHGVLGAPGSINVLRPGVAYVFRADSNSWVQRQTISAQDGIDRNGFGVRVSICTNRMVVKASGDTTQGVGAGAVYLFILEDSVWLQRYKFLASDGAAGANYGECTISDSTVIIGALNARTGGVIKGAAYIYEQETVGVAGGEVLPGKIHLYQNFPNPFNPRTEIRWELSEARWVTLKVYDILGREVKTLVDEMKSAGEYATVFDAGNLASGVYYYRLIAGRSHHTKRMLLIK